MLRTKLARKKLTKTQQRHLSEMNIHSMAAFRQTREMQKKQAEEYNTPLVCVCPICHEIEKRLEI